MFHKFSEQPYLKPKLGLLGIKFSCFTPQEYLTFFLSKHLSKLALKHKINLLCYLVTVKQSYINALGLCRMKLTNILLYLYLLGVRWTSTLWGLPTVVTLLCFFYEQITMTKAIKMFHQFAYHHATSTAFL